METRSLVIKSLVGVAAVAAMGTLASARTARAQGASPMSDATVQPTPTAAAMVCTPAKSVTLATDANSVTAGSGRESYWTTNCHAFLAEISVPGVHPGGAGVKVGGGADVHTFTKAECDNTSVTVSVSAKKAGATKFSVLGSYKLVGHWIPLNAPGFQEYRGCGLAKGSGTIPATQAYPAAGKTDTYRVSVSGAHGTTHIPVQAVASNVAQIY